MFLTVWDNIRDYIQNNITFGSIITLIVGILLGMLIAFLIYLILVVKSIKKSEKNIIVDKNDENEKLVNEYIENSISRYDDVTKGNEIGERITEAKEIISTLVVDIAKVYYPESKHPLAELTVEEVIALDRYIVDRVEGIFNKKALRLLMNKKISIVFNIIDKKNEIEENKLVKSAKKYHIKDIGGTISKVVNAINPVYWVKKGVLGTTINIATNYIVHAIIRIIGSETAKIYSKNVFTIDEEKINNEIDNIEYEEKGE